ncbi:hypothetical protein BDV12DRAFT_109721 [Aspergillus spectabilis]
MHCTGPLGDTRCPIQVLGIRVRDSSREGWELARMIRSHEDRGGFMIDDIVRCRGSDRHACAGVCAVWAVCTLVPALLGRTSPCRRIVDRHGFLLKDQ